MSKLILVIIGLIFSFAFCLYSQTTDSTIYLGGDDDVPYPKDGFKGIQTNILKVIPDTINLENIIDTPIYSIRVNYPGYVDSILILKTSGNNALDKYIEIGFMNSKFIYPDTLNGYPSIKWIAIPIKTKQLFKKKKSLWELLKFW